MGAGGPADAVAGRDCGGGGAVIPTLFTLFVLLLLGLVWFCLPRRQPDAEPEIIVIVGEWSDHKSDENNQDIRRQRAV